MPLALITLTTLGDLYGATGDHREAVDAAQRAKIQ